MPRGDDMHTSSNRRGDVKNARSFLFVPGDRSDRFEKAAQAGADVVVCDLEDAVSPENKDGARERVAAWLANGGRAMVRVNPTDSRLFEPDCAAIVTLPGLLGIMIAKSENCDRIAEAAPLLAPDAVIVPLIETAAGLWHAAEIAALPKVSRLGFGAIDFALDIRASGDDATLLYARSTLVTVSRAAGIAAPIDGVTTALDNSTAVTAAASRARQLGFRAKLCVHPKQVDAVNQAFQPTQEEVEWARLILSSLPKDGDNSRETGAHRVGEYMVDRPVIERAQRIIHEAGALAAPASRFESRS